MTAWYILARCCQSFAVFRSCLRHYSRERTFPGDGSSVDDQRVKPGSERDSIRKAHHDPEAFRDLYDHYFPKVYAYVSYRVGRAQDAEDLVAETFLKAIEGLDDFEGKHAGSFAAWLFRIAHNTLVSFYRQQGRREEPVPLDELPDLEANTLLPDDIMLQKEKLAYLRSLIHTLSPRQQEVITLKFFGELRNREIAEALGLSERTVAAYLCRGLEELHRTYVEDSAGGVRAREAFNG